MERPSKKKSFGDSQDANEILESCREQILAIWEERIKKINPELAKESHSVVRDSIPQFLENIIETLKKDSSAIIFQKLESVSTQHGRQRARRTNSAIPTVF